MSPLTNRPTGGGHHERRRHRRLLAIGLALAGLAVSGAPAAASAQNDGGTDDAPASDVSPHVEALKLGCHVRQNAETAGVRCRWSTPTSPAAAGLRLWRVTVGSDQGRQVVFRTEDITVSTHTDVPVRPGHRYVYAIQAVNEAGRTVGMSRPVLVGVPRPPDDTPDVEVLRIECVVGGATEVGCKWTLPSEAGARTLTLWRSLDGGARERVLSSHHPFPTAYRDTVPEGTHRAAYAVVATDGSGEIVARSRAAFVAFRDRPVTDVAPSDVKPSDVAPSDVAPSDVAPSDVKPSDVAPSDVKPSDVAPSDVRPSDVKPSDVAPSDVAPSDVRPSDVKPSDVAPSDVRPSDVKPSDVAPSDVKPSDVKPADVAPSDVKPSDPRPDPRPDPQPDPRPDPRPDTTDERPDETDEPAAPSPDRRGSGD